MSNSYITVLQSDNEIVSIFKCKGSLTVLQFLFLRFYLIIKYHNTYLLGIDFALFMLNLSDAKGFQKFLKKRKKIIHAKVEHPLTKKEVLHLTSYLGSQYLKL